MAKETPIEVDLLTNAAGKFVVVKDVEDLFEICVNVHGSNASGHEAVFD